VSKSAARWDPEKLKWMNGEYLRRMSDADLAGRLQQEKSEVYRHIASVMDPVAMTAAGRAKFQLLSDHEAFLLAMAEPRHPEESLAKEHLGEAGKGVLREASERLKKLGEW